MMDEREMARQARRAVRHNKLALAILAGLAHREGYCVLVTTHSPTVARQADAVRYLQDGVLAPER